VLQTMYNITQSEASVQVPNGSTRRGHTDSVTSALRAAISTAFDSRALKRKFFCSVGFTVRRVHEATKDTPAAACQRA